MSNYDRRSDRDLDRLNQGLFKSLTESGAVKVDEAAVRRAEEARRLERERQAEAEHNPKKRFGRRTDEKKVQEKKPTRQERRAEKAKPFGVNAANDIASAAVKKQEAAPVQRAAQPQPASQAPAQRPVQQPQQTAQAVQAPVQRPVQQPQQTAQTPVQRPAQPPQPQAAQAPAQRPVQQPQPAAQTPVQRAAQQPQPAPAAAPMSESVRRALAVQPENSVEQGVRNVQSVRNIERTAPESRKRLYREVPDIKLTPTVQKAAAAGAEQSELRTSGEHHTSSEHHSHGEHHTSGEHHSHSERHSSGEHHSHSEHYSSGEHHHHSGHHSHGEHHSHSEHHSTANASYSRAPQTRQGMQDPNGEQARREAQNPASPQRKSVQPTYDRDDRYDRGGRRRRGGGIGKVIGIIVAIILGVIILAGIAAFLLLHTFYDKSNYVEDTAVTLHLEEAESELELESEPENYDISKVQIVDPEKAKGTAGILLIGSDRRDSSWYGNSDTMVLLTINYDKKQVYMTSFMRDLYADIPNVGVRKLNNAYAVGGGPLLVETLRKNYGVDIDNYATVDFGKMEQIIDLAGGVDVQIDEDEAKYMSNSGYAVSVGKCHLDGKAAVAYSRIRYVGNSDWERTARQREVLFSLLTTVRGMSPTTITSMANQILPLVTHNMTTPEVTSWITKIPSIVKYNFVQERVPFDGMYYIDNEILVPDLDKTVAKLHEELYGE